MYRPYVTASEYYGSGHEAVAAEDVTKVLIRASRHVDALTFNRIQGIGFDNLTQFQKDCIQEVVCEQADFLYENADMIESMLSAYSINGVSMSFGDGPTVRWESGLPIKASVYKVLEQTGLCCRLAR